MKESLLKEMSARYAKFFLAVCLLLCVGGVSAQDFDKPEGIPYTDPVSGLCFKLYSIDEQGNKNYWAETVAPERNSAESASYKVMTELNIPSSVTNDGITYPVTAVGYSSFSGMSYLKKVHVPASVTTIGSQAFSDCAILDTVIVEPNAEGCYGLTSIESSAFNWCKSLSCINLPPSLNSIGEVSFAHCALKEITIPEKVESVGQDCFWLCQSLKKVEWNAAADIPKECFLYCEELQNVVISGGVKMLGESCFGGVGLTSLVLPKSVSHIVGKIFKSCVNIISLNPEPPFLDQVLSQKDDIAGSSLYVPEGSVDAYKAAYGWKKYGDSIHVANLGPVEAPNGLLYDIDLYSGNATLRKNTDANGNSLYTASDYVIASEDIEANGREYAVRAVADGAFENCKNLRNLDLPATLASLGKDVFKGCDNLKSLIVYGDVPSKIPELQFDENLYANCHVYVPKNALANYKATEGWKNFGENLEAQKEFLQAENGLQFTFKLGKDPHAIVSNFEVDKAQDASHIEIPTSVDCYNRTYPVTGLGGECFYDCTTLQEVKIPETITTVGENCFSGCQNLVNVVMPANLMAVPGFSDCTSLKSIVLPANAENLSNTGFSGCTALEEVTLPTNVKKIPRSFFYGCSSLKHIDLPESLETIEESAFYGTALEEVKLPESVTKLESYAFERCASLISVYLPLDIQEIGQDCFNGCTSLANLYNPSSEPIDLKENIADEDVYQRCTLWVPVGMTQRYSYANIWKKFNSIKDFYYSGIDAVDADANNAANAPVYNLNGVCVSKSGNIEGLSKGSIYIVNGKKVIK